LGSIRPFGCHVIYETTEWIVIKFGIVGTAKHVGWIQLWSVWFLICMEFISNLLVFVENFRCCKSLYIIWAFLL